MRSEHIIVGTRVKCVSISLIDVNDKTGKVCRVDGRRFYIEWDDPAINLTGRHHSYWDSTSVFELLPCPENQQLLAEELDMARRKK